MRGPSAERTATRARRRYGHEVRRVLQLVALVFAVSCASAFVPGVRGPLGAAAVAIAAGLVCGAALGAAGAIADAVEREFRARQAERIRAVTAAWPSRR